MALLAIAALLAVGTCSAIRNQGTVYYLEAAEHQRWKREMVEEMERLGRSQDEIAMRIRQFDRQYRIKESSR